MQEACHRPMMELVVAAFQQASRKVVELALLSGTPVFVWKDAAVVTMDPPQVLKDLTPKQDCAVMSGRWAAQRM